MDFIFSWNEEKNAKLILERGLSFDLVVKAAALGLIVDDYEHPSETRPHQRIIVIDVRGYMVAVPYVVDGNTKFLKTMFFDRNLQSRYGTQNGPA